MFVRLFLVALLATVAWAVVVRASTAAGPERAYTVKPGDTLWSIAARAYRGDPREGIWLLRQRNGIRAAVIRPGQRLVLP